MRATPADEAASVVARARDAMAADDAGTLRLLLHPYLHWTNPDGSTIRGRLNVLAALSVEDVPDVPLAVELRDGQIYRWTCRPLAE